MIELALSAILTCEDAKRLMDNLITHAEMAPAGKVEVMNEIMNASPEGCWE